MNFVQIVTLSALGLLLAGGGLTAAGASLCDIGRARRDRQLARHPHARRLRYRPLISVIVYSHRDTGSLADCLDSLAAGYYRKYELIIIRENRAAVKTAVKPFETAHPSKTVRILPDGSKSLQRALKVAKGELVMVMDRPAQLEQSVLKRAANYLALEPKLKVWLIEPVILARPSLSDLSNRFKAVAAAQLRKSAEAYGLAGLAGRPAVYRRQNRGRPAGAKPAAIWLSGAAAATALTTYGVYLAAASVTTYLLAILWSGLVVFLLLAIWSDNRLGPSQKLRMALLTPVAGGLLYLGFLLGILKSTARGLGSRI